MPKFNRKQGKSMETQRKRNMKTLAATLYCLCRQPHNERFMIGCDICEEWFHGDCVNVSEAQARQIDVWLCVNCERYKLSEENNNLVMRNVDLLCDLKEKEMERNRLLNDLLNLRKNQLKYLEKDIAMVREEMSSLGKSNHILPSPAIGLQNIVSEENNEQLNKNSDVVIQNPCDTVQLSNHILPSSAIGLQNIVSEENNEQLNENSDVMIQNPCDTVQLLEKAKIISTDESVDNQTDEIVTSADRRLIGNIGDDMNCSNEDVIYCSDEEGKTASSVTAVDKSRLENVEDVNICNNECIEIGTPVISRGKSYMENVEDKATQSSMSTLFLKSPLTMNRMNIQIKSCRKQSKLSLRKERKT